MPGFLAAFGSVFGLGFAYFIAALPAGAALGLPLWLAALAAWLGYSAGGLLVAFGGGALRDWITRKMRVDASPSRPTLLLRAWQRFGLPGLGLIAPVTVGPQIGAVLALALGAKQGPAAFWLAIGAIPWAVLFAALTAAGIHIAR